MRKLLLPSLTLFALWLAFTDTTHANGIFTGGFRSRQVVRERVVVQKQVVQQVRVQQVVQRQVVQQVAVKQFVQPVYAVQSFRSYYAAPVVASYIQPVYAAPIYTPPAYSAPQAFTQDCCEQLRAELAAFREEMRQALRAPVQAPPK